MLADTADAACRCSFEVVDGIGVCLQQLREGAATGTSGTAVALSVVFLLMLAIVALFCGFALGLYRGEWLLARFFGIQHTSAHNRTFVIEAGAGGAPEMKSVRESSTSAKVRELKLRRQKCCHLHR